LALLLLLLLLALRPQKRRRLLARRSRKRREVVGKWAQEKEPARPLIPLACWRLLASVLGQL
jgi:hypothetical protein